MVTTRPGRWINEYDGLSEKAGDEKPKLYVPNGSKYHEMDTSAEYVYDEQNQKWYLKAQAPNNGSGQGDGTAVSIALTGAWAGDDPYTQAVTITGYETTPNTRADIMPDDAVVAQMIQDGVETIYIENSNGVFTAYAVGGKPSRAYNLTITLTEVG